MKMKVKIMMKKMKIKNQKKNHEYKLNKKMNKIKKKKRIVYLQEINESTEKNIKKKANIKIILNIYKIKENMMMKIIAINKNFNIKLKNIM